MRYDDDDRVKVIKSDRILGIILKIMPTGLSGLLDVGCERKGRTQVDSKVFDLVGRVELSFTE